MRGAAVLLLIAVTVLAGLASRRAGRGGESRGLVRPATALTLWAMAAKPA